MKKYLLYLLVFSLLGFFIYQADFDFRQLMNLDIYTLFTLSVIYVSGFYTSALFYQIGFRSFGVNEKTRNYFYYSTASQLLNYLPLKLNLVFLGDFLKKKHNLSISKYLFVIFINYLFIFSSAFILGIYSFFFSDITPFFKYFNTNTVVKTITVLILATLGALVVYKIFYRKLRKFNLKAHYKSFKVFFQKRKSTLLNLQAIVLLQIVMFGLRLYIIYQALDIEISFNNCLLLGVLSIFSFLFSVTPGSIGIKESLQGGLTYILLGDFEIGAIVALIDRTINLFWTLMIGGYATKYQLKEYLKIKNS